MGKGSGEGARNKKYKFSNYNNISSAGSIFTNVGRVTTVIILIITTFPVVVLPLLATLTPTPSPLALPKKLFF